MAKDLSIGELCELWDLVRELNKHIYEKEPEGWVGMNPITFERKYHV